MVQKGGRITRLPSVASSSDARVLSESVAQTTAQVEVNGRGSFYSIPRSLSEDIVKRPAFRDEGATVESGRALLSGRARIFRTQPSYGDRGKLQLRRFEDVFDTLDHDITHHDTHAEVLIAKSSTKEYEKAISQRAQICVADVVGGSELAEDSKFLNQVHRGRKAVEHKGIIFAGLARDIGKSGAKLFATLRAVGKTFARHHIIVLENNSKDRWTRKDLKHECRSKDTWCFLLDVESMKDKKQDQGVENRVEHLTNLRQSLLEEIRKLVKSSKKKTWDLVMMFDGDIFDRGSHGFHPTLIDALLGLRQAPLPWTLGEEPLDVVCANQVANWPRAGRYRDTFALKTREWNETQREPGADELYFTGNKLLPVKSCFSGLALYSMAAIKTQCNYTYLAEDVCEHVSFHQCLADKGHGRVAIYPPLVVHTNDKGVPRDHCEDLPKNASKKSAKSTAVLFENNNDTEIATPASVSLAWKELLEKTWSLEKVHKKPPSVFQQSQARIFASTHRKRKQLLRVPSYSKSRKTEKPVIPKAHIRRQKL